jgi:hypothetical protein
LQNHFNDVSIMTESVGTVCRDPKDFCCFCEANLNFSIWKCRKGCINPTTIESKYLIANQGNPLCDIKMKGLKYGVRYWYCQKSCYLKSFGRWYNFNRGKLKHPEEQHRNNEISVGSGNAASDTLKTIKPVKPSNEIKYCRIPLSTVASSSHTTCCLCTGGFLTSDATVISDSLRSMLILTHGHYVSESARLHSTI